MQLGLTALVLVPALVIVGTMLAAESYRQVAEVAASAAPDLRAAAEATVTRKEDILLSQLRAGLLFPLFIALAMLARHSDPGFHKRMMILGTASVMGAAIARVPGLPTSAPHSPISTELYILLLAVPMFARDLLRNGYVHRAYWVWLAHPADPDNHAGAVGHALVAQRRARGAVGLGQVTSGPLAKSLRVMT